MELKKTGVLLKILLVIGLLAAIVCAIFLLGFLLDLFQTAWAWILSIWAGFGKFLPPGLKIWSYIGALCLMLLSGFFFPTVMDRLNELSQPRLITPLKIVYAMSSFIILCGTAFLALSSMSEEFGMWSLAQLAGVLIGFGLAVKLWCRN